MSVAASHLNTGLWVRTHGSYGAGTTLSYPITQEFFCKTPQEFYEGFNSLLSCNDGQFVVHIPFGGENHMLEFFQNILTQNDNGEHHFLGAVLLETHEEEDRCRIFFQMPFESPHHQAQPTDGGDCDVDSD